MARRHRNPAEPVLASLFRDSIAFALAESMLAQAHAQSILYTNAVIAQQQTTLLDHLALAGSVSTILDRMGPPGMWRVKGGNGNGRPPAKREVDSLLKTAQEEVTVAAEELQAARQEARDARDLAQEALQIVSGRPVVT